MIDNLLNINIKNGNIINCNNRELYNQLILYLSDLNKKSDILIVVPNLSDANKIYNDLINYKKEVFLFPEDDYLTKHALASSPEFLLSRINFLNNLENYENKVIITNINGFCKKLPSPRDYSNLKIDIKVGDKFDRKSIIEKLVSIGYKMESIVTETGEFAVRGFVIDIFPIGYENPIRLEFFDDEIDEIKVFDEITQRSKKNLKTCQIMPISDELELKSDFYLKDYLKNGLVIFQDSQQLNIVEKNINEQKKYFEDYDFYDYRSIKLDNNIFINTINTELKADFNLEAISLQADINSYDKLKEFTSKKHKIYFYYTNKDFINKVDDLNLIKINKTLMHSFMYKNICYITEKDVFNFETKKTYKSTFKLGTKINELTDLKVGDYVVHKKHGIGIYAGIKTINKNDVKKDYILINYKGNDKLYIPAQNITTLYKYSSKDGVKPKIYKLNSIEWEKTKRKIKNKVKDISGQLIKIYKERNKAYIEPYEKDTPEQLVFENEFPYQFTTDQIKVTNEIKIDLESSKPMERLLCGDVGYGKTEVIFRVMFKSVLNNKQVAYLCPTTLLANQQYNSAISRFKNHAVNIEVVTRHTTTKELNRIIKELEEGKIDIIFGTHKLFNKKFKYKDLGLLVIDEEHRFGVEHKEKIKELKSNINVLSVSATPIPRSLQMSLVGIRDMSLIETPPLNRYPVQTYVINYDELLLKEVLLKELSRDGQAFVLYNNVSNIEKITDKIKQLLPGFNVDFVHGQMYKSTVDDVMENFVNRKIDILVATTIIENGIDIPNANTIVVLQADRFGLSQLYQIRGRVGRSDKIAYAYFMYDPSKVLTETAKKRLEAIKEFTKLGSGYKISMRDLSIRGAGDLLGKEQAGFIDSVGVDMYLELVNEELSETVEEDEEEKKYYIDDVETHISEKYSDQDEIIIELHKMINSISSLKDYENVYSEIEDRFGIVDEKLKMYLDQELLESYLKRLNIDNFSNNKYKVTFKLDENIYKLLNIENLFMESLKISTKFNFKYQNSSIIITLNKLGIENKYIVYLNKLFSYIIKEAKY